MYVEKLTMKDFRCFEQAEVSFVYPGKEGLPAEALNNVTLLVGINGIGKTSVLKGCVLGALAGGVHSIGYVPYCLVRRQGENSPRKAVVSVRAIGNYPDEVSTGLDGVTFTSSGTGFRVEVACRSDSFFDSFIQYRLTVWPNSGRSGSPKSEVAFGTGDEVFQDEHSPLYFIVGYGATRRTEYTESLDSQRSRRRHPRFQRVAGLFEDYITLYPLAAWYPTLESKPRQKEVRELLNGLLPEGTEFTGEFKDADAIFKHNGVKLPFGALSDGFRSYIGLVADMLYHLNYVCPKKSKLTDLSGVVMIDDIDVHLHPKWQREVVPKLAGTFPKLQFIITSHSPLVAGTLHAANIRVIEDNQLHEYTERIHGLSADQILLSSYFGHVPPRSPDAVDKLNRIADRVADDGDPTAAIEFLNELAGKTNGKTGKKKK